MTRSCIRFRSLLHPSKLQIPSKNLYDKVSDKDIFKIEGELVSLDPKSFDSIKDFIIKVNELRTKLTDCGNPIKDDRLIYHIHNKLPSEYSTFVSS